MYQINDTIAAVSTPCSDKRVIVRISGPDTKETLEKVFSPLIIQDKACLINGTITIDAELKIDAKVYLFIAGHSYTGETLAEIHFDSNTSVTNALMTSLLSKGLRMAGPGEFTARAYLNGKIDLSQAEAVNEIITSANNFQLDAAEKLLAGRLTDTTELVRTEIMDCLSLIEAGLDFSGEDIEFISRDEAIMKLSEMKGKLEKLLDGSISYETVIGLPCVGIAGAPNAGKSSLLNKLLGQERSIVSRQPKTTRDILSGQITLSHSQCVLFDCAGLIEHPETILDELSQRAALEALKNSAFIIFCVDISKADWKEDIAIRQLIEAKHSIAVGTKSDLLNSKKMNAHIGELNKLFNTTFLETSAKKGSGIEILLSKIDDKVLELIGSGKVFSENLRDTLALTARHKQAVTEAINNINEAVKQLKEDKDEVAAMMLRTAYQGLSEISRQNVDEQILEKIFHNFCIGK